MKSLLAPAIAGLALTAAMLALPALPAAQADGSSGSDGDTVTVTMPSMTIVDGSAAGLYGDRIYFEIGDAVANGGENAGYAPPVGTFQLQEHLTGTPGWKVVESAASGATSSPNWSVRLRGNARVRFYYTGGTDQEPDNTSGGTDTVTYEPAYSPDVPILSALYVVTLHAPKGTVQKGRVGPSYDRRWVRVGQVTHGKETTIGGTRTDAKGRFSFDFRPTRHGRATYVLHFAGTRHLTATKYTERLTW